MSREVEDARSRSKTPITRADIEAKFARAARRGRRADRGREGAGHRDRGRRRRC